MELSSPTGRPEKNAEIVIVGSCNTDLISYITRLPLPGETLHGNDFSMGCGGKGANQCVAAAKLGGNTAMVGKVGNDTFGEVFLKKFLEIGVNTKFLKFGDDSPTGSATILVDSQGENSIIIVPGANYKISVDDILEMEEMISKSKILLCQGEILEETTIKALYIAQKHNVMTIMNAAPASKTMNPEIYKLSSIFCVNETEANILTGINVSSVEDAKKASLQLIERGCSMVIVTLGRKGATFCSSNKFFHVEVPTKVHSVIDTTGAGDAFIGALAFFITKTEDVNWKNVIGKACAVASYSVQFKGTQTSFPTLDQFYKHNQV